MARPINSLESIEINGVEQWVLIQSADMGLPVLLVLHGGPGYAILPLFHEFNRALEDHFVVVNWDQKGAGRSVSGDSPGPRLTLEDYLADLKALLAMLAVRFGRSRVYLLGHSWGTLLGLHAVGRWPDDYGAFVGVGQVVSVARNEVVMYDRTLARAERAGKADAVEQLEAIGRPDGRGRYPQGGDRAYDVAERWMAFFGGDLWRRRSTALLDQWLLGRPEYRGAWGRKWRFGLKDSGRAFDDPAVWETDFSEGLTRVEVPVYFFSGVHDGDTPGELVADYHAKLSAPDKGLFWFEKSAHFPFYEEPDLFNQRLIGLLSSTGGET